MGNLDSLRDWGHARDYVEMQWLMLQQEQPEDFVIATGRQESVRRFIELSARQLGWGPMQWEGEGIAEVGHRGDTGDVVVRIDYATSDLLRWTLFLVIPAKHARSWAGRRRQVWRNWWLRWFSSTLRKRKKRHTSSAMDFLWWEQKNDADQSQ